MLLILVVIRINDFQIKDQGPKSFFLYLSIFDPKSTTVLYTVVFSFSITSSNMSKNFTLCPANGRATCMISYPFQETEGVVENNGFEPLTPCVQGRCSSQLS
jgi:hypothetical protein